MWVLLACLVAATYKSVESIYTTVRILFTTTEIQVKPKNK
jgi:hypothetical protein